MYQNRQYRLVSSRRSDAIWSYQVRLERAISKRATASVYYRYRKNHSNVAVFDFDRQVMGVAVTMNIE